MEKINIAELLKDCPKGMELDCTIFNSITFGGIDSGSSYPIKINIGNKNTVTEWLTEFGEWNANENSKCVIFPKGKTTWEGFVPPIEFKDGDILCNSKTKQPFILKFFDLLNNNIHSYCGIDGSNKFYTSSNNWAYASDIRLATEEEKQELFKAIKENGYKWNEETKTLEKLIEPKFKVGNKIKEINSNEYVVLITDITDDYYIGETEYCMKVAISMNVQNNYELVPNKFDITTLKPFESKVLARDSNNDEWRGQYH